MLIVAVPKSASTALLATLGARHGLSHRQSVYPGRPWPSGFPALARWHSDVREIGPEQVAEFARPDRFFKQHIPPTRVNRRLLATTPKVVLVRDPIDVVLAYRRAHVMGLHHSRRREFVGLEDADEQTWMHRARQIGLVQDLRRFVRGWRRVRNTLMVDYADLVNDPGRCFDAIEDYFGLDRTERPVELEKERYTRDGG